MSVTSWLQAAVLVGVLLAVIKPLGAHMARVYGEGAARADGARWDEPASASPCSLFIAGLAFLPGDLDDAGILLASLLAGTAGAALLTRLAVRAR